MSEVDNEAKRLLKANLKSLITHAIAVVTGFALGCLLCL